jgi:hypothetical protein
MYGEPRKLPTPPSATTATALISKSSPLFGHNMQLALLFFVLLFSFLSVYFGLFKMAASASGKEKFANLSMVNIIV